MADTASDKAGTSKGEVEDAVEQLVEEEEDEMEDAVEQLAEEEDDTRKCWICSAADKQDEVAVWVHPCRCSGTTKWVHHECIIQRWVDDTQNGNKCPYCNTEYVITFLATCPVAAMMDTVDIVISKMCPFAAAGIVVGSMYAIAITFGTLTVIQVCGRYEGLIAVARADTSTCLLGLPSILFLLILSNMVPWEEKLLGFLREHSNEVPLLDYLLPGSSEVAHVPPVPPMPVFEYVTRVVCSALITPTVAIRFGEIFFASAKSNVHRTLFGGLAFVATRGVLKMYRMQQQHVYPLEIIDYPD